MTTAGSQLKTVRLKIMKILAIESSGLTASIAVADRDRLIAEYTIDYKKTHSQTLLPMLDEVRKMTELDLDTVDAIAISNGPGSFTGLRIGAATAKGLGFALDKPLIEVPTLEALAYNLVGTDKAVFPIMDARRNQVYTAGYTFVRNENEPSGYECVTLLAPTAIAIEELADMVSGEDREVVFTGDGCPVYKDVLDRMLSGRAHSYAPFTQSRQRAGSVALAAFSYFEKGLTVSADDSHPEYLRLSQAERELMEKKKADGEG